MVKIPDGTFTMGSPPSERERRKYEGPRNGVAVADVAIAATEVTREQYAAFVTDTPRSSAGGCFTYGFSSFTDLGNDWEFVADCWYEELPLSGAAHVEGTNKYRRTRGGSWDDFPEELRWARRSRLEPRLHRNDSTFRVARELVDAERE